MSRDEYFEKAWYQSKKFLAFLITMLVLAGITVMTLLYQTISWPLTAYMTGIVFVMGWTTTLFMGKQAELDLFVRGLGRQPATVEEPKKESAPISDTTL